VPTRPIYDLGVPDVNDESSKLTVYVKNLLPSKIFSKSHSYLTTISIDYWINVP
jgi:hypothetical protein